MMGLDCGVIGSVGVVYCLVVFGIMWWIHQQNTMVKLYFTIVNYYVTAVTFFDSKKAGVAKKFLFGFDQLQRR